ncbi:MAG: hypothetical protein R3336_02105, partial [Phycisphaeraceae bacterium]|nr:hypothetical protein [Phycisphaeraceae bacterium]
VRFTLTKEGDNRVRIKGTDETFLRVVRLSFLDEDGKALSSDLRSWGTSSSYGTYRDFEVKGLDDDTRVVVGLRPKVTVVDVPFVLRDVPLPGTDSPAKDEIELEAEPVNP